MDETPHGQMLKPEFLKALLKKSLLQKVNKAVTLLRKFQNILPVSALLTIYKCFVRSHLNYGHIIYDQAFNNSFHKKLNPSLREKCPKTEFLLVRIQENTDQKKLRIWTLFTQYLQYNVALAIAGAIRGKLREKSCQELR